MKLVCLRILRCLFVSILFGWPLLVSATHGEQFQETIVLGVSEYGPIIKHNEVTGECEGDAIDATKALFAAQGLLVEALCLPPARLYRLIARGVVDVTINIKSTQRLAPLVDFSIRPFSKIDLVVYSNPQIIEPTVAAIRSFDYEGMRQVLALDGYQFVDLPTIGDTFEMFTKGRTGYLLTYHNPFKHFLVSNDIKQENYHHKVMNSIKTYYAVSKKSKHHEALSFLFESDLTAPDDAMYYDSPL